LIIILTLSWSGIYISFIRSWSVYRWDWLCYIIIRYCVYILPLISMCNMILALDYWNKDLHIDPDYIDWVLMILLTLDIGYRDDRDVILIEDVALFNQDLDYSWINLLFKDVSFFVHDLNIYCFSRSRVYQ